MLKLFLTTIFLLSAFTRVSSEDLSEYTQCEWISEVLPDATFRIKKHLEGTARSLKRADLIYKNKVIRSIVYGAPNGYGSRWWAYENGIEVKDGRTKVIQKGGGLRIILVGDENIPERSLLTSKRYEIKPRKVLLTGLGKDLHYVFKSRKDITNSPLISAAEGYWRYSDNCSLIRGIDY